MQRVLVAGATGYLGRHLVDVLRGDGHRVRALARRPEQAASFPDDVEVFIGQVTEPASLDGVMDGIDTVYSTVGITRQRDHLHYLDVDYAANLTLLRLAERADVTRFVYVSVLHGRELRSTVRLAAAKERFVDQLHASPLSSVVVRPTAYFSDMDSFATMARRGAVYLIGDGRRRMNPISGGDLARACARAARSTSSEIEVGGPDVLTHEQIARAAFAAQGAPPRLRRLPAAAVTSLIRLLAHVTPERIYGPAQFLAAVLTRDMTAPPTGSEHLADHFTAQAGSAS